MYISVIQFTTVTARMRKILSTEMLPTGPKRIVWGLIEKIEEEFPFTMDWKGDDWLVCVLEVDANLHRSFINSIFQNAVDNA